MIDLAKPISGFAPSAGLEAGVGEFFAEQFQRHAVLQRDGDGAGEAVHEAGDGGAFLGHGDEEFSGLAVGIEADDDVALVSADVELVRDRHALFRQAVTDGTRRRVEVLLQAGAASASARRRFEDAVLVPAADSG